MKEKRKMEKEGKKDRKKKRVKYCDYIAIGGRGENSQKFYLFLFFYFLFSSVSCQ